MSTNTVQIIFGEFNTGNHNMVKKNTYMDIFAPNLLKSYNPKELLKTAYVQFTMPKYSSSAYAGGYSMTGLAKQYVPYMKDMKEMKF